MCNVFKYKGVVHIHSVYSDGTGDINKISLAAKKAKLDWIIITDHNNFDFQEGIYNGVYVIKGEEISSDDKNHYLALGINNCIEPNDNPDIFIKEVQRQGGFGFAAHPFESTTRKNPYPPIRWNNKNIRPDGVEVWNWFSSWADALDTTNIFSLIYSYLFSNNLVTKPNDETIKWWDELNNKSLNIIPAIAGVDAHALKIDKYFIPVTIFPYEKMFKTINNVIELNQKLNSNFNIAKLQILNALKIGNNIIINRKFLDTSPNIYVENENILKIKCNKKCQLQVFCEGVEIENITAKEFDIKMEKCKKYRIVGLFCNKVSFISNMFVVF